jgi:hypothetical protein
MLYIQTAVVNNPTFIELQHHTLKYFINGPYKFTVYNDAKEFPDYSNFGDTGTRKSIAKKCEQLNIECIPIVNDLHKNVKSAATRCADAMNRLLADQRSTTDRYLVLDSDMFPIRSFSSNIYDGYDCAIVEQHRVGSTGVPVTYAWNGIYYFDMGRLQQKERLCWDEANVEGQWTDVGGAMHPYLRDVNPRTYKIQHYASCQWDALNFPFDLSVDWLFYLQNDSRNKDGKFFSELYDKTFLHFRAGGNWEQRSANEYTTNVKSLMDTVYRVCR